MNLMKYIFFFSFSLDKRRNENLEKKGMSLVIAVIVSFEKLIISVIML
jgi:hypothetical protein